MPYTRLRYHLVWATKHRDPMITEEMEEPIRIALFNKAKDKRGQIVVVGGVKDHIHVVVAIPPSIDVSAFVRELKTASSRAVKSAFPHKSIFGWQKGYGAFTVDPYTMDGVVQYVVNQKQHHAQNKLLYFYEKWEE